MLVENPEHQLAPLVDILYEAVLVRSDSLPSSLTMWDLLRPDTLVSVSSGSCWGQHTAVSSHISISFKHPLSEPSSGSINNHDIAVHLYTQNFKTTNIVAPVFQFMNSLQQDLHLHWGLLWEILLSSHNNQAFPSLWLCWSQVTWTRGWFHYCHLTPQKVKNCLFTITLFVPVSEQ